MTVRELERRMNSQELSEWAAYTRYFEAIPDQWRQTGLIAAALLAPYSKQGSAPKVEDFVPLQEPPQHPEQMKEQLQVLARRLGIT